MGGGASLIEKEPSRVKSDSSSLARGERKRREGREEGRKEGREGGKDASRQREAEVGRGCQGRWREAEGGRLGRKRQIIRQMTGAGR